MDPKRFSHFAFWGFELQWKNNPLSFEVSIAEMMKWILGAFRILRFGVLNYSGRETLVL
jgi:hypothetical protein